MDIYIFCLFLQRGSERVTRPNKQVGRVLSIVQSDTRALSSWH